MKKLVLSFFALSSFFILSAQQTPQPDSLKEYTGKYKFPEGSVVTEVTVTIENGALYATSVMGNSELKKIEKDVFEIVSFSGKAFFIIALCFKTVGIPGRVLQNLPIRL